MATVHVSCKHTACWDVASTNSLKPHSKDATSQNIVKRIFFFFFFGHSFQEVKRYFKPLLLETLRIMAYRCELTIRVIHKLNTNIFSKIAGLLSSVFSSLMHLILGWASCMNDCIGEVGALLRSDGRPGCISGSGLSSFSWHYWSRSGGQSGTVTPWSSNLLL